MAAIRSLVDLCIDAVADEINGKLDDCTLRSGIYELPPELVDGVLTRLTPLALQKLQDKWPLEFGRTSDNDNDNHRQSRKRKRNGVLDAAWYNLYLIRWPPCYQKPNNENDSDDDWQQMYWERHLHDCIEAVAEIALLPSFDGSIGEIEIPVCILECIGSNNHIIKSTPCCLKFSYHCIQFQNYIRNLKLPSPLFITEACDLLQCSRLVSLEIQWIKLNEDVGGLCKLLHRNSETIKSVYFIHCKFALSSIDAICDSLQMKGLQQHGVEHFTIKRSSLFQNDSSPMPSGFASFLRFGKNLRSLTLSDAQLGRNFARETLSCLLDAPTSISSLDLSENNISGSFSRLTWKSSSSLRALNLRSCGLVRDDIYHLKHTLLQLPNLQSLDLSDNSLGDGIRSLIVYFSEIISRNFSLSDLKLETCDLRCEDVAELLEVLSNMKRPLNLLSLKGNHLGSQFGSSFGKFLCSGVSVLDVGYVGLGPSGFVAAAKEITKELDIEYIDISNNFGRIEAAQFVSIIISCARKKVAVYARSNSMPAEALSVISQGFKTAQGKLKHLDLCGNHFSGEASFANAIVSSNMRRICVDIPLLKYRCWMMEMNLVIMILSWCNASNGMVVPQL